MTTKLIKVDDVYRLVEDTKHGNSIIGTTDLDYQKSWSDRCQKLSIKNCQAIERGYDLDELAYEYDLDTIENVYGQVKAFKAGFQKALELMGDKKFSEDDMKKSYILGCEKGLTHPYHVEIETKPLLQQTEWDVEIEMHIVPEGLENKPRLDADGCLILRKK